MKNKLQKIVLILISIIGFALCLQSKSYAASFKASVSSKTVTVGDTITLTLTADNAAGNYKVTISDTSKLSVSSGSTAEWLEDKSTTIKLKANAVGSVTVKAEATDMADLDNSRNKVKDSHSYTITIKEKETTPTTTNNGGGTTSKPKEPTFTKVNETVYVTKKVNVRQSYSTSSKSLATLEVGTSLTRTGKGSNGWSRVTYNGKEAYVNASYLSTKKPEEKPTEEETPTEKSSNVALKSLKVTPGELSPSFAKETTSYDMQVEQSITEVTIEALAEDEKTKVEVTGNKDLQLGDNTVTITVTAEDETTRTYTITVLRGESLEKPQLMLVSTGNGKFNPTFQSDVYSYELTLTENVSKLDLTITTLDDNTKYEVVGNEKLQDGSVVKIIVYTGEKNADGSNQTEYVIKIKKEGMAPASIFEEIDQTTLIVIATIVLVVIAIVALCVARHFSPKDKKKKPEEGDFGAFDGLSGTKTKADKEDEDFDFMNRNFSKMNDDFNSKNDDFGFGGDDKPPRGKRFM